MLNRIKRIRSHAGHAGYLAECTEEVVGTIPRQEDIPSPYQYSQEWNVFQHGSGKFVVIRETAHRCYDVFEVPEEMISKGV